MKNMQLLTKDLRMKISEWLPSTFSMIERYFALESVLQKRDPDIASMLPTASDNIELQLLLTEFESITKSYSICTSYEGFEDYSGSGASLLTHYSDFEPDGASKIRGLELSFQHNKRVRYQFYHIKLILTIRKVHHMPKQFLPMPT